MSDAADRLQHLITTVHPPRRDPWTDAEIAAETQQRDTPLSADDVQALRTGAMRMDEATMVQLAAFFGVSPAYFTDPEVAADVDRQLEFVKVFAEFGVRSMMLCSRPVGTAARPKLADLDPEELRAELQRLEQIRHERLQDTRDERVSRDGRTGRETRSAREPRTSWWTRTIRNTSKRRKNV